MKGFNQKMLWQVLLIFFEAITTTWCWSYVIFIILSEHYNSERYYYNIGYLYIFKYTNYLLALSIPFFYIFKTHSVYAWLNKHNKARHHILILNQCFKLILFLFLPHLFYWGYSILVYAIVGYIEQTIILRVGIIILYLILTYRSLLSFKSDLKLRGNSG